jgi:DNA-directed RNA polymerase subunit beta
MRELQSLGLDIAVHKVENAPDGTSRNVEVDSDGRCRSSARPLAPPTNP